MNKKNTLKSWLLSGPIFFATISFLFMIIVTIIVGMFARDNSTGFTLIGTLITLSTICAAILTLRRLPGKNMDRTSFINIHNAQALIVALASLASLITAIYIIPIRFWLFSLMQSQTGVILSIIIAILLVFVSLYIAGVALCGFWAKFWRAIDMKIPMWKIILSIPFGFSMTWIPGYFLPTKAVKNPTIVAHTSWYAKITNWILSRPSNAGFAFAILIGISGFFTGPAPVLLTLTLTMLFAIWAIRIGPKAFTKNIGDAYANTAIIINIIMLAYTLLTTYMLH